MGIEFNSDKNSKVSFTEPDVKDGKNRYNLHDEILGVSAEKYEQLQVELEECRNRIEELKLHRDEEKAGKEQTLKTLATYVKKTRDERQQYVQQINSLEIIVMMLKLKAKNSANHASRLEERLQELKTENEQLQSHCDFMMNIIIEGGYEMDTGQTDKVTSSNNNPTVSRNIDLNVTTGSTAPTFTFGSTSSTGTTSTSAFTLGHAPKTTQSSSSSGYVFASTSSNAPSSLGTNPSVPPINFETQPNFNFLNQAVTQGQPFRFAADTGAVAVQRNLKKAKRRLPRN